MNICPKCNHLIEHHTEEGCTAVFPNHGWLSCPCMLTAAQLVPAGSEDTCVKCKATVGPGGHDPVFFSTEDGTFCNMCGSEQP